MVTPRLGHHDAAGDDAGEHQTHRHRPDTRRESKLSSTRLPVETAPDPVAAETPNQAVSMLKVEVSTPGTVAVVTPTVREGDAGFPAAQATCTVAPATGTGTQALVDVPPARATCSRTSAVVPYLRYCTANAFVAVAVRPAKIVSTRALAAEVPVVIPGTRENAALYTGSALGVVSTT